MENLHILLQALLERECVPSKAPMDITPLRGGKPAVLSPLATRDPFLLAHANFYPGIDPVAEARTPSEPGHVPLFYACFKQLLRRIYMNAQGGDLLPPKVDKDAILALSGLLKDPGMALAGLVDSSLDWTNQYEVDEALRAIGIGATEDALSEITHRYYRIETLPTFNTAKQFYFAMLRLLQPEHNLHNRLREGEGDRDFIPEDEVDRSEFPLDYAWARGVGRLMGQTDESGSILTTTINGLSYASESDIDKQKQVMVVHPTALVHEHKCRTFKPKTFASNRGQMLNGRLHRYLTDGRIFKARGGRRKTASILLDMSGSMSFTIDQVDELMTQAPASIIAGYAGYDGSYQSEHGIQGCLAILARDGRRVKAFRRLAHGGNEVDHRALEWLSKQPHPRVWISDCGISGSRVVAARMLKQFKIINAMNMNVALKLFKAIYPTGQGNTSTDQRIKATLYALPGR